MRLSCASICLETVAPLKAPARMPISVMPICTVERKRSGASASSRAARAPASLSARCCNRAFRDDTTAISDMAKTPLAISNRMMKIISTVESLVEELDRSGDQRWFALESGLQTTRQNPADFALDVFRRHPLHDARDSRDFVLPLIVDVRKITDSGNQRQQIPPGWVSTELERARIIDHLDLRDDRHRFANYGFRGAGNGGHSMSGAISQPFRRASRRWRCFRGDRRRRR